MATRAERLLLRLEADTKQLRAELNKAGNITDRQSRRMERSLGRVDRGFGSVMQSVRRFGGALAVLGGAAGFIGVLRQTGRFNEALAKTVGLVGINRRQVQAWRRDILALAGEVGRSPQALAEALFFVTSAGLRGADALNTLRASAKASASGLGETKDVALAAGAAMNAYGSANLSAEMAVATLIATVREGNLEASALAGSIGQVIGTAAEMKIEFHEVGAAIAALTRVGRNAEQAVTEINGILLALLKTGGAAEAQLKKVNLSFEQLRRIAADEGLLAAMLKIRDAFKGNAAAMRLVITDARAFRGMLSLVGSTAETTKEIFASLAQTTEDDVNRTFEETDNELRKVTRATESLNASMIILGSEILPTVAEGFEAIADAMPDVVDAFRHVEDRGTKFQGRDFIEAVRETLAEIEDLQEQITAMRGAHRGSFGDAVQEFFGLADSEDIVADLERRIGELRQRVAALFAAGPLRSGPPGAGLAPSGGTPSGVTGKDKGAAEAAGFIPKPSRFSRRDAAETRAFEARQREVDNMVKTVDRILEERARERKGVLQLFEGLEDERLQLQDAEIAMVRRTEARKLTVVAEALDKRLISEGEAAGARAEIELITNIRIKEATERLGEGQRRAAERIVAVWETAGSNIENALLRAFENTGTAAERLRLLLVNLIFEVQRALVSQSTGGKGLGALLGGAVAGLFGGTAATGGATMSASAAAALPATFMARGGSFTVGGSGGTDSQLVPLRLTPREQVTVTPPGRGTGGNTYVSVRLNASLGIAATVQAELMSMLPMISEIAVAAVVDAQARNPRLLAGR